MTLFPILSFTPLWLIYFITEILYHLLPFTYFSHFVPAPLWQSHLDFLYRLFCFVSLFLDSTWSVKLCIICLSLISFSIKPLDPSILSKMDCWVIFLSLCVCVCVCVCLLFIHFFIVGHMVCFHILAIVSNDAINRVDTSPQMNDFIFFK